MLPDVSVVMGVYNGSNELPSTIRSLQAQSLVNFELIIVDDGSTDDSASVAKSFAATDHRIRLITQDNQGLTAALNNGCRSARARVIARQDVGDVSLPERLSRQFEYLTQHLDVVAISCGANRLGPEHEFLGEERPKSTAKEVTADLLERGTGLLHAASMFRKEPFEASGCYRKQFRFAQDTDLWYRLSECGLLSNTKEVLFEYCIDISGISPQNRARQRRLGQLARECFLARQRGDAGRSQPSELGHLNRAVHQPKTRAGCCGLLCR